MLRTETVLGGLFLACWLVALGYTAGLLPAPAPLPLNLYGLFTFAAAFGWLAAAFSKAATSASACLPRCTCCAWPQ